MKSADCETLERRRGERQLRLYSSFGAEVSVALLCSMQWLLSAAGLLLLLPLPSISAAQLSWVRQVSDSQPLLLFLRAAISASRDTAC